ncbi:MAG: histidine kinase [Saonia sp.]
MQDRNTFQRLQDLEPVLHLFFWCAVLFFPYLKYVEREGGYPFSFTHELTALVFNMIPAYVMYFWFFPKRNKKKNLWIVILLFTGTATIYYEVDTVFHEMENHQSHYWRALLSSLVTYISISLAFFALYSIKMGYRKQVELDAIVHGKKQAEMNALKARINPHFLFNTLNTIYANALKGDKKTPDLLLQLSDGFRYLLHEGQQQRVPIAQELKHIKNYIALQKERLNNKVRVDFEASLDNEHIEIAPLLLITFVENAFKYSSMLKGAGHLIQVKMVVKDGQFFFSVKNPSALTGKEKGDATWRASGIGIQNTKKRLQLLYPKRHLLEINGTEGTFNVTLNIQL